MLRQPLVEPVQRSEQPHVAVQVDDRLGRAKQMRDYARLQRAAQLDDAVADAHRVEFGQLERSRREDLERLRGGVDEVLERVHDEHRQTRIRLVDAQRLGERTRVRDPCSVDDRADVHARGL